MEIFSNSQDALSTTDIALFQNAVEAEKALIAKQNEITSYLIEVKKLEDSVKKMRESLVPVLSKLKCYNERGKEVAPYIENDFVRFTLVRGFQKETVDLDTLQTMEPKLYKQLLEKYSKPVSRKDTVRHTFKYVEVVSE